MSKVITFSRTFPAYHPKAGQPTYFVEQIWNSLNYLQLPVPKNKDVPKDFLWSILPLSNYGMKNHTIRGGSRFKVGDKFSPRVWSGKPYNSKQIIIAPDIEIISAQKITIGFFDDEDVMVDGKTYSNIKENPFAYMGKNDGLEHQDFIDWFTLSPDFKKTKKFTGQIICWNENINY